jgi:hypothetical protein
VGQNTMQNLTKYDANDNDLACSSQDEPIISMI